MNVSKKNNNKKSKKENVTFWIIGLIIASFIISSALLFVSSLALESVSMFFALLILIIIIFIGIVFDTIGMAVAGADISVFHSKASNKIFGAKRSIWLIKHADKVTSICNDFIGDICGVISGAASAMIVIYTFGTFDNSGRSWGNLIISGLVACITIGGKAVGKRIAIKRKNDIVFNVGVILQFFSKKEG